MSVENAVLALAGLMVTISVVLAWLISPLWLILTLFVGLNLFQSAFSGFCPAAMIFKRLGLKTSCVVR